MRLDSKHFGLCTYKRLKLPYGGIVSAKDNPHTKKYILMSDLNIAYNKGLGVGGFSEVYTAFYKGKTYAAKCI